MHVTGSATGEATYSRFQLPRRELPVALFTFHSIPHVRLIWLSVNCRRCPLWESWLGAGLIKASWNGLGDERIAHDTVHLSTRQDRNDEVVELSKPTDKQIKGMNDRKIFSIKYTKLRRKILCNLMKGTWSCGTLLQIKDESINSWGKRGGEIPQTACVSKYVVASVHHGIVLGWAVAYLFYALQQSSWFLRANHYSRMPVIFFALGDGSSLLPIPFHIIMGKSCAFGQSHQKQQLK